MESAMLQVALVEEALVTLEEEEEEVETQEADPVEMEGLQAQIHPA